MKIGRFGVNLVKCLTMAGRISESGSGAEGKRRRRLRRQALLRGPRPLPKSPDRMQLLEAIKFLPSEALVPMHWVRTLLAMAEREVRVNGSGRLTEQRRGAKKVREWLSRDFRP